MKPEHRNAIQILSTCYLISAIIQLAITAITFIIFIIFYGLTAAMELLATGGCCCISTFVGCFAGIGLLSAIILPIFHWITAKYLKEERGWTMCLIVSIITALAFPIGTVLGGFTIYFLAQDDVKKVFEQNG